MVATVFARSLAYMNKKVPKTPRGSPKTAKFVENLGGRLAMQGFTWGTINHAVLNETFQEQVKDPHNLMMAAAVTSLVCVASTITAKYTDEESYFAWTPDAETLNGRVAMASILAAFALNV